MYSIDPREINIPPMESGSSAFSQFFGSRQQRFRDDSLSEAWVQMLFAAPRSRLQQQQFFPIVHPTAHLNMQPEKQLFPKQFFPQQSFEIKMPIVKDMKPLIERFTEKEEYRGVGAGIQDRGLQLLDELGAAQ